MSSPRLLGLKNTVFNREGWRYLLFYDIDSHSTGNNGTVGDAKRAMHAIAELLGERDITSFLIYSTKHGYHVVGLTPLSASEWGSAFEQCQSIHPSFYSGQTIRLSRKQDEHQRLVTYYTREDTCQRVLRLYAKRFPELQECIIADYDDGYRPVGETYRSRKR